MAPEFLRPPIEFIDLLAGNLFNFFLVIVSLVTLFYLVMILYIVFIVRNRKEFEEEFITEKAPFVSIQIPTRNELAAITCAKHCLKFDYPKNKMEILIGDDSNKPEISRKLNEFASKYSLVRIIRREKNTGFKAGNLNNLLSHSKGKFLVIFDSDYSPSIDFLKRIITPFQYDNKLSGVQARWRPVNSSQNLVSVLSSNIIHVFHLIMLPFMKSTCDTVTLCGSAEALRRSDLEKLGKWQQGSLTEDIEYSFRLFQKNKRILYLEDLECECEAPFTPIDLYRQQMRWAYGVICALKEHLFKTISSNEISFKRKFPLFMSSVGYTFILLLLCLFTSGMLSFLNDPIMLTYGAIADGLFRTLIVSSFTIGPLFASIFVLYLTKKIRNVLRLIVSTFSIGIIVIYYVNIGIAKAFLNKPMEWFLVTKKGNEL